MSDGEVSTASRIGKARGSAASSGSPSPSRARPALPAPSRGRETCSRDSSEPCNDLPTKRASSPEPRKSTEACSRDLSERQDESPPMLVSLLGNPEACFRGSLERREESPSMPLSPDRERRMREVHGDVGGVVNTGRGVGDGGGDGGGSEDGDSVEEGEIVGGGRPDAERSTRPCQTLAWNPRTGEEEARRSGERGRGSHDSGKRRRVSDSASDPACDGGPVRRDKGTTRNNTAIGEGSSIGKDKGVKMEESSNSSSSDGGSGGGSGSGKNSGGETGAKGSEQPGRPKLAWNPHAYGREMPSGERSRRRASQNATHGTNRVSRELDGPRRPKARNSPRSCSPSAKKSEVGSAGRGSEARRQMGTGGGGDESAAAVITAARSSGKRKRSVAAAGRDGGDAEGSPPRLPARSFGQDSEKANGDTTKRRVAAADPSAAAQKKLVNAKEESPESTLGDDDRQGSFLDGDGSGATSVTASTSGATLSKNKRKLAKKRKLANLTATAAPGESGGGRPRRRRSQGEESEVGYGDSGGKGLSESTASALGMLSAAYADAEASGEPDDSGSDHESGGRSNTLLGGGGRGCIGINSTLSTATVSPCAFAAASPRADVVERQGRAKRLRKNARKARLQRNSQVTLVATRERGSVLVGKPKRSKGLQAAGYSFARRITD